MLHVLPADFALHAYYCIGAVVRCACNLHHARGLSHAQYITLAVFLLNLRQTFRVLDSVLPKYMLRSIGCEAPIGTVYGINPAIILLLVPLVTALTTTVSHFDMIWAGSWVSASSPFWVFAWASPALAGDIAFVVQLSLGEALWSPRWYDYTMDVAPAGPFGPIPACASLRRCSA